MGLRLNSSRHFLTFVIGIDNFTGLQTARILRRRKIPVIGLAKSLQHPCARTNTCERKVEVGHGETALVDTLLELGNRLERKGVLIPCTDGDVCAISRHRDKLAPYFLFSLPDAPIVDKLMDKKSFLEFARKEKLPVPETFFLRTQKQAEKAAELVPYPCILKPTYKSARWEQHAKYKAFLIETPEALLANYRQYAPLADLLMVQRWIAGSDADHYTCNVYFDRNGQPLVTFVSRKIRQWPPHTGTACLCEEVENETVLQTTLELFSRVAYRGLGYLEMKRDARDGCYYIVEPNIGRPTGRSALAEASGVELLSTMYCELTGQPLPENRQQLYRGYKWIYFRRDVQSALHYYRGGELSLGDWVRSLRGIKAEALFAWRDPLPFFGDLLKGVRFLLGKRTKVPQQAPETPVARKRLPSAPIEKIEKEAISG